MQTSILHVGYNSETVQIKEDWHANSRNVFVVADGVTHDLDESGNYPNPSDSALVARSVCDSLVTSLNRASTSLQDIRNAFVAANSKVARINEQSSRYMNRESNGYDIGAATVAAIVIDGTRLLYGVLDDCYVSVFGGDYIDHPILKSHVDWSAKYLDAHFDWANIETRKLWRKEFRNSKYIANGQMYGYGALDGREGFLDYLQLGEVKLNKGDLVCVYTDGFIKLVQDRKFIQELRERPFSPETHEFITNKALELQANKEMTGYFIQV